jgi:hypothetical protein
LGTPTAAQLVVYVGEVCVSEWECSNCNDGTCHVRMVYRTVTVLTSVMRHLAKWFTNPFYTSRFSPASTLDCAEKITADWP